MQVGQAFGWLRANVCGSESHHWRGSLTRPWLVPPVIRKVVVDGVEAWLNRTRIDGTSRYWAREVTSIQLRLGQRASVQAPALEWEHEP